MKNFPIPRIDKDIRLKELLENYCRLRRGEIWSDPQKKHRIGCLDASSEDDIEKITRDRQLKLAVHDPPYNMIAFNKEIGLRSHITF